ncbi:MAG: uroporphyrinogen decarboxylase [Anaerolineae bacterium]|nr:uroporphyrinogen decarboxylase [Anaerolineae bacterium]
MTTENFETRMGRVQDAIALKKPDRVPLFAWFHLFPARYVGMTYEEAFYDLDKWLAAYEKTVVDYSPDLYVHPSAPVAAAGAAHEALANRQMKWPGHGVGPNRSFQFVEGEYMKAEEYDAFLNDPSDWTVRVFLPRIYGNLEGLAHLPPLSSMLVGYVGSGMTGVLTIPPIAAAFDALFKAAQVSMQWSMAYGQFTQKLAGMGYPTFATSVALAPYDLISDMLRGMRGTMKDMYRCPDKLLAAMDKVLPLQIGGAIGQAHMSQNPLIFIPLHRGADGFMSNEQFETFYWPTLKALILALIDAGLVPCPFFEGTYDQRLDYLTELPPGKVMGCFDRSDLVKVKEVLGGKMCIAGGMPISLLQHGTPEQVRAETRTIIETVGQDGGFIMSSSTVLDEADPELVRAWAEATREYGAY